MPIDPPLHNLVAQLSRVGLRPEKRLVNQILAYGAAARPELLRLATKTEDLHTPLPTALGPLHALRLLGEVPDVDMIEPLFAVLPVDIYGEEDVPARLYATEIAQMIGRIGPPALPAILAIANDPEQPNFVRGAAISALPSVVAYTPEVREEVLTLARNLISAGESTTLATAAAATLADLGDRASYRMVMDGYRSGLLNQHEVPAADIRQLMLSGGRQDLACVQHSLWERYDHHGPFAAPQQG